MMVGIGIGIAAAAAARAPGFDPTGLFASGEQGIWLDPSDLMTLYQDSAGTTPVAAAGQPVGRILDKSGRGNHATQPVASRRPTLGRHPVGGRRNFLRYTEDFTSVYWTGVYPITRTANATTDPLDGLSADLLVFEVANTSRISLNVFPPGGYAPGDYTLSVWLRSQSGAAENFRIGFFGVGNETTVTIDGVWRRFSVSCRPTTNTSTFTVVMRGQSAYQGVYLWGAQLELGSEATAYQKVVSAYDVTEAGKSDCWYLETDGVDDFLVTPTITPNIDKAQVFAGVRAIGTATGIVVENGDASTTNGTFALASPNAYLNLTHWSEMRGSTRLFSDTGTFPTIGPPRTDVVSFLYDIGGATPAAEMLPRLNGESKTLNVPAPPDNSAGTGNFLAYPLYIGGRGGTIYPFKGNLYGLAVRFGPNLDEATIAKTEAWLNTKTGAY